MPYQNKFLCFVRGILDQDHAEDDSEVGDFMNDLIKSINDVANQVFQFILVLLPTSPFSKLELPEPIQDMLGYVNYYVPISQMLIIAGSWIGCIAVYYVYQLILRKISAIS